MGYIGHKFGATTATARYLFLWGGHANGILDSSKKKESPDTMDPLSKKQKAKKKEEQSYQCRIWPTQKVQGPISCLVCQQKVTQTLFQRSYSYLQSSKHWCWHIYIYIIFHQNKSSKIHQKFHQNHHFLHQISSWDPLDSTGSSGNPWGIHGPGPAQRAPGCEPRRWRECWEPSWRSSWDSLENMVKYDILIIDDYCILLMIIVYSCSIWYVDVFCV